MDSFHTTAIEQLVTPEQLASLQALEANATRAYRGDTDLAVTMTCLLNVAAARLRGVGLPEDVARFRTAARLFARVVASGTTYGVEADIRDLAVVLIGLG